MMLTLPLTVWYLNVSISIMQFLFCPTVLSFWLVNFLLSVALFLYSDVTEGHISFFLFLLEQKHVYHVQDNLGGKRKYRTALYFFPCQSHMQKVLLKNNVFLKRMFNE